MFEPDFEFSSNCDCERDSLCTGNATRTVYLERGYALLQCNICGEVAVDELDESDFIQGTVAVESSDSPF